MRSGPRSARAATAVLMAAAALQALPGSALYGVRDAVPVALSQKPASDVAPAIDTQALPNDAANPKPALAYFLSDASSPSELRLANVSNNSLLFPLQIDRTVGGGFLNVDASLGQAGSPPGPTSQMQEERSVAGTPVIAWIEDGRLRGCTLTSAGDSCAGGIITQATVDDQPVVAFALTPQLVAWKQQAPYGYDLYVETAGPLGGLPLSASSTGTLVADRNQDAVLAATGSLVAWDSGDYVLITDMSGLTTPALKPNLLMPGPVDSLAIAAVAGEPSRVEMVYENDDGNTWRLYTTQLTYAINQAWEILGPTRQVIDPSRTCSALDAVSPSTCYHPVPAGQVVLPKGPVNPQDFWILYSGNMCRAGTGPLTSFQCTQQAPGVNYIAGGTLNAAADPVTIPTPVGATAFGNLDLDGSNAVWEELDPQAGGMGQGVWHSYYYDLNPVDQVSASGVASPIALSSPHMRYARRSDAAVSGWHAVFLDDRYNSVEGATELMALDLSNPYAPECRILTSAGAPVPNCATPARGLEAPASAQVVGGLQGPLSLEGSVAGYLQESRSASGGILTSASVVDTSAAQPAPIILDTGDSSASPSRALSAPVLGGTPASPAAAWIATVGWPARFDIRGTSDVFALGPNAPAVTYYSAPANTLRSVRDPQVIAGNLAPSVLFVTTSGSFQATDSIDEVPMIAGVTTPSTLYTTAPGHRITAMSTDGTWVAWTERVINPDGSPGAGTVYAAALQGSGWLGCAQSPQAGQGPCTVLSTSPVALAGIDDVSVADQQAAWSDASQGTPQVEVALLPRATVSPFSVSGSMVGALAPALGTHLGPNDPDMLLWIDYTSAAVGPGGAEVWSYPLSPP